MPLVKFRLKMVKSDVRITGATGLRMVNPAHVMLVKPRWIDGKQGEAIDETTIVFSNGTSTDVEGNVEYVAAKISQAMI